MFTAKMLTIKKTANPVICITNSSRYLFVMCSCLINKKRPFSKNDSSNKDLCVHPDNLNKTKSPIILKTGLLGALALLSVLFLQRNNSVKGKPLCLPLTILIVKVYTILNNSQHPFFSTFFSQNSVDKSSDRRLISLKSCLCISNHRGENNF